MKYTFKGRVFTLIALILLSVFSCKKMDNYNQITSTDKTKPDVVTNVKVNNYRGGAYITYTLPKSENLLYVLAEYKINDSLTRQVKSSYYSDTIRVDGFARSKDYDVTLYSVSRAEIKSDPVKVVVHPDTPPYLAVAPTVTIAPDFGGVHVEAFNADKMPVGVIVITKNANKEWVPIEQVYSSAQSISFSVRGYDTIPIQFGVYITDPWSNRSDTQYATITPIFEKEFAKTKFKDSRLSTDAALYTTAWTMSNLWNGTSATGYHTALGTGMPQTLTFDMGVTGKLSRYKIWERGGGSAFAHGNPKRWAMWGATTPTDIALPANVSGLTPGQAVGNWIFMGYYEAPPKPSGKAAGDNTAEDLAFNDAGFEYNFSLNIPAVRYIRFQTLESFSGGDFMHLMEISLWGN